MKADLNCRGDDSGVLNKLGETLCLGIGKFRDLQFKLDVPLSYSLEYDMTYLNLK